MNLTMKSATKQTINPLLILWIKNTSKTAEQPLTALGRPGMAHSTQQ
jgi:hypothetical protein